MRRISRIFGGGSDPVLASSETVHGSAEALKQSIAERSIDEARRLRLVVIGAGISGILSCIRFRQRIPNIDICIYDKNEDIGGTWLENRYPGCACGMKDFDPKL
jgi:hypothetical protein